MKHVLSVDDREVALEYLPSLNLATLRAGLAPVSSLEAGDALPPGLDLRFSIPEISYLETGQLDQSGAIALKPRTTAELEAALERIVRPMHVYLRVSGGDEILAEVPVSVLPAWYWPHQPESRLSVSTLVLPGHDRVSQIVAESFFRMKDDLELSSIEEMLVPERMGGIPPMLYHHLTTEWKILYSKPRVEMDEWSEGSCQPVLEPGKVLRGDRGQQGEGNCLDLSLLFAGALETVGMKPLLVFTGESGQAPEHVVLGWWTDHGQRFRPILDDPTMLRNKLEKGELQVLDATGVCLPPHRLDYEKAITVAQELFAGPVHAVDVCAGRQPYGSVGSMIIENNPLVQRVIWAGQEFTEESQAAQRQAAHVLYGLCKVKGETTVWLLTKAGGGAKQVQSTIERSLPRGRETEHAATTKNYEVCLSSARLNARGRGSQFIEEEDLLWAVLENPSSNIRKILEASGCEWNVLLEGLRSKTRPARGTMVYNVIPPQEE